MKKLIAAIVAAALLLPAPYAAASGMVTVTYPDGTIVQMSLEDYQTLFVNGGTQETNVPQSQSLFDTPQTQPGQGAGQSLFTDTQPDSDTPWNTGTAVVAPWPTYTLQKYPLEVVLLEESKRKMGYLGPSKNYRESDAYKPYKFSRTEGLFKEGSYVFVDMNYPSVGVRRTYFQLGTFKSTSSVPDATLIGYPAVTTDSVNARYGPGPVYDPFPEASVGPNTELTVFFEEAGYVFAEYMAGFELVRAWIDANDVAPQ